MYKRKIVIKPPGPKFKEYLERAKKVGSGYKTWTEWADVFEEGKGVYIKDVDGNIYLDFWSQAFVNYLGFCHPKLVETAYEQMKKLTHVIGLTEPPIKLAEKLVRLTPGDFAKRVAYTIGGANTMNIAAKLVKTYKGKSTFISFWGAFHGRQGEALSLTAGYHYKKGFGPWSADVIRLPYPYCYRCPFGLEYPDCSMRCLGFIENMFSSKKYGFYEPKTGETDIGAIFVEPISGSGKIVPPDEWLPGLRKICDKYGFLLVDDEVQTGLGRTGKWFATEHWGVIPDIICFGKMLGGGLWPIEAVVAKSEIYEGWAPFHGHLGTFCNNVIGSAIALQVLKTLKEEKIIERTAKLGEYCLNFLRDMAEDHKTIVDPRGKGLFMSVEMVKDIRTKEPAVEEVDKIRHRAREKGLLLSCRGPLDNRIEIVPPLIITKEQIDEGLEIVEETVTEVESKM